MRGIRNKGHLTVLFVALAVCGGCAKGYSSNALVKPKQDAASSDAQVSDASRDSSSVMVDAGIDAQPTDRSPWAEESDADAGQVDAGQADTSAADASFGCTSAAQCNDGIQCTVDACADGTCTNTPNDSICGYGYTCGSNGCEHAVSICEDSPCSPVSPTCGCEGSRSCKIDAAGQRNCIVPGAFSQGEACSQTSQCAAGLHCANMRSSGAMMGICRAYCRTNEDCSGGALCLASLTDPDLGLCSDACNVVAQTGCPTNSKCVVSTTSSGNAFTKCVERLGTSTNRCSTSDTCASGYACIGGYCERYCDYLTDEGCSALSTCLHASNTVSQRPTINGREIGFCL